MTMSGERRFCPFCGREIEPVWRHCPGCGNLLTALLDGGPEPGTEIVPVRAAESPVPRDERRWNEAVLRLRLGELDRAGAVLMEMVRETPRNASAFALLGAVSLRQHRIEEARGYLDRAVLLEPDSPFVRLKVAEYWLALGVPSRALAELTEAEAAAGDDLDLVVQVRAVARKIRADARGTILLEPPALPASGPFSIFKRMRHSPSAG